MGMTQEEKQLLLKDLSARLPYGVMVSAQGGEFDFYKYPYQLTAVSKFGLDRFCKVYHPIYTPFGVPNIEDIKPYLRSMSSMTEEEEEEYEEVIRGSFEKQLEFYLRKHFDFRGLIEKGLALEALDGMYDK